MKKRKSQKKKSKADSVGGLVFVGALMLGLGLGLYYERPDVGSLSGLGVGFILFGLIKALMKD